MEPPANLFKWRTLLREGEHHELRVFKDGDRISRPFQTEGDAWDCANDAGLVENVSSGGGSVQVLDGHCTIKSCDTEFVMPANLA
jgi:hypothetical protein